jgi:hypothetical protein
LADRGVGCARRCVFPSPLEKGRPARTIESYVKEIPAAQKRQIFLMLKLRDPPHFFPAKVRIAEDKLTPPR